MPYKLVGNKVVKSSTGEVVKDHGDDHAKAVRHLRALKANVEETRLCECGAPSHDGLVCQRGHRLQEAWSPQARLAALAARRGERSENEGALSHFSNGSVLWHDDLTGKGVASDTLDRLANQGALTRFETQGMRWYHKPDDSLARVRAATLRGQTKPLAGGFKPRPPQELALRGR